MPALDNLSRVADVSYTIARRVGSLTVSAIRQVAGMAFERRSRSRTSTAWTPPPPVSGASASTTPRQAPAPAPAPARAPNREPTSPAAPVPTPAAAAEPVAPEPAEAAEPSEDHVSREAVVVAESADAGAADGAGAQIRIGEPWEGYGKLTAKQVNARLATASPESLAVARLYETANRNRVTVLKEIDRRLAAAAS
ncbi:MAG TPA: hypothetical protein VGV90_09420 [Solirubrobacteraceae bacterium]|nr:hypothetical protein [Solirubrobacteraceae bacterium]